MSIHKFLLFSIKTSGCMRPLVTWEGLVRIRKRKVTKREREIEGNRKEYSMGKIFSRERVRDNRELGLKKVSCKFAFILHDRLN